MTFALNNEGLSCTETESFARKNTNNTARFLSGDRFPSLVQWNGQDFASLTTMDKYLLDHAQVRNYAWVKSLLRKFMFILSTYLPVVADTTYYTKFKVLGITNKFYLTA